MVHHWEGYPPSLLLTPLVTLLVHIKAVKKLCSGNFLVEATQSPTCCKPKPLEVHHSLITSKGVVQSQDHWSESEESINVEPLHQGVIATH